MKQNKFHPIWRWGLCPASVHFSLSGDREKPIPERVIRPYRSFQSTPGLVAGRSPAGMASSSKRMFVSHGRRHI